jgi:hypothetical protein
MNEISVFTGALSQSSASQRQKVGGRCIANAEEAPKAATYRGFFHHE